MQAGQAALMAFTGGYGIKADVLLTTRVVFYLFLNYRVPKAPEHNKESYEMLLISLSERCTPPRK